MAPIVSAVAEYLLNAGEPPRIKSRGRWQAATYRCYLLRLLV